VLSVVQARFRHQAQSR